MDLYDQCQFLTEKWLEFKKTFSGTDILVDLMAEKGRLLKFYVELSAQRKPNHSIEWRVLCQRVGMIRLWKITKEKGSLILFNVATNGRNTKQ